MFGTKVKRISLSALITCNAMNCSGGVAFLALMLLAAYHWYVHCEYALISKQ